MLAHSAPRWIQAALVLFLTSPVHAQLMRTELVSRPGATQPRLLQAHAQTGYVQAADRADRDAQEAALRYSAFLMEGASPHGFGAAIEALRVAEVELNERLLEAWEATALGSSQPTLINEPLLLAGLELQVFMRRRLGPANPTAVPGLRDDRGCQGDLIGERLLYRYMSAAASPRMTLADASVGTSEALEPIAIQVMCLGARQLASFERAFVSGVDTIVERLERRDLHALVPSFLRVVAPAAVLLHDARKHRGADATSVGFFERHGGTILAESDANGWASGQLLLWDRRHALLVGLPLCGAKPEPGCVELSTFIASLSDPRALGPGDCGLAAMVTQPLESLGGDDRYACPAQPCSSSAGSAGSLGDGLASFATTGSRSPLSFVSATASGMSPDVEAGLQSQWPGLGTGDLRDMASLCRPEATDYQMAHVDLGSCLPQGPPASPFDHYTACMADALGAGEEPQLGGALPGVPRGNQCGLAFIDDILRGLVEGIQKGVELMLSPLVEGVKLLPEPEPEQPREKPEKVQEPEVQPADSGPDLLDIDGVLNDDPADDGEMDLEYMEGLEKLADIAKKLGDKEFKEDVERWLEDTEPTDEELQEMLDSLEEEDDDYDNSGSSIPASCAEPDCTNSCTAVGQLLSEIEACTNDLLDGLAGALGRPRPDPANPPDIVSYPNPEAETPGDPEGFSCLGGDTGPTRPPAVCGLILCADGLSAGSDIDACSCGDAGGVFVINQLCHEVRCADGTLPDADCQCGPNEDPGLPPDTGPGPDPLGGLQPLSKSSGPLATLEPTPLAKPKSTVQSTGSLGSAGGTKSLSSFSKSTLTTTAAPMSGVSARGALTSAWLR